jgi:hypothetical protein
MPRAPSTFRCGPAVTEDVTHQPHSRATSRDTAHPDGCSPWSLTTQETTTTNGSGMRTSNPRVAGSTPARRTNNDDYFESSAPSVTPSCAEPCAERLAATGRATSIRATAVRRCSGARCPYHAGPPRRRRCAEDHGSGPSAGSRRPGRYSSSRGVQARRRRGCSTAPHAASRLAPQRHSPEELTRVASAAL